jgi:hypothetical protein
MSHRCRCCHRHFRKQAEHACREDVVIRDRHVPEYRSARADPRAADQRIRAQLIALGMLMPAGSERQA